MTMNVPVSETSLAFRNQSSLALQRNKTACPGITEASHVVKQS